MKNIRLILIFLCLFILSLKSFADSGACVKAERKAKLMCKGAVLLQKTQELQLLATIISQVKATTYTKKACEAAGKINSIMVGLNAAAGASCLFSVSKCKSICKEDSDDNLYESCDILKVTGFLSFAQVLQNAVAISQSKKCVSDVSEINHKYNSTVPIAHAIAFGEVVSLEVREPAFEFDENEIGGSDYDFNGSHIEPTPTKVNVGYESTNKFNPEGSESFSFGEEPKEIKNDILDKEILTNQGSGVAVGMINESSSWKKTNGNSDDNEFDFDLSAFLPKGTKDPTRNPSSAGYEDHTITKANGLSNWQKITRKMNEKRAELTP